MLAISQTTESFLSYYLKKIPLLIFLFLTGNVGVNTLHEKQQQLKDGVLKSHLLHTVNEKLDFLVSNPKRENVYNRKHKTNGAHTTGYL